MKWIAFTGEIIGFLSSILLAWGYAPAKGTMTWIGKDEAGFHRDKKRREIGIRIGFGALAISFAIQAIVTLASN